MNEKNIEDFLLFRKGADRLEDTTLLLNQKILETFDRFLKKLFKNATETDILGYLEGYADTTRNSRIVILRKFYRWLYELDKEDKLPKCIRRIKPTPSRILEKDQVIDLRERRISPDEYNRLIDSAKTPQHKAMIETLYKVGPRISEFLSINATGVKYDGVFTRIIVRKSKTMPREIVDKGRLEYLMKYVESYQLFGGKKDKPLWANIYGNRFSKRGMLGMVRSATKRAGINRVITLHDFRHTSISNDRDKGIPITHIETKHGLVYGSLMMKRYDHNKTKNYEEYLNKVKEETPEMYETIKQEKDKLKESYENKLSKLNSKIEDLKSKFGRIEDEANTWKKLSQNGKSTINKKKINIQWYQNMMGGFAVNFAFLMNPENIIRIKELRAKYKDNTKYRKQLLEFKEGWAGTKEARDDTLAFTDFMTITANIGMKLGNKNENLV